MEEDLDPVTGPVLQHRLELIRVAAAGHEIRIVLDRLFEGRPPLLLLANLVVAHEPVDRVTHDHQEPDIGKVLRDQGHHVHQAVAGGDLADGTMLGGDPAEQIPVPVDPPVVCTIDEVRLLGVRQVGLGVVALRVDPRGPAPRRLTIGNVRGPSLVAVLIDRPVCAGAVQSCGERIIDGTVNHVQPTTESGSRGPTARRPAAGRPRRPRRPLRSAGSSPADPHPEMTPSRSSTPTRPSQLMSPCTTACRSSSSSDAA